MVSCSRVMLAFLNVVILLSAVSHVIMAHNIKYGSSESPCAYGNAVSMLWMGVFITITTTIGILGSCFKIKALQSIYLWVLLILTTATVVFTVFIFALLPKHSGIQTFQQGAADGRWLSMYKPALQKALVNEKDWFVVKTCYTEARICEYIRNQTDVDQKVSYVQLGCCNPPSRCGLVQKNISFWEAPPTGLASKDEECLMWMNLETECFECDSCKAGYLANYLEQWDESKATHISRMVLLSITSALACYAFNDDHDDDQDDDHGPKHRKHAHCHRV